MQTIETIIETYTRLTCSECGIFFFLPGHYNKKRLEDGKTFYCLNGHGQHYGVSETDRLRKELEQTQNQVRGLKCDLIMQQHLTEEEAKAKARAERKLKRVSRGVCPDCNRTFENLARHMKCKHGVKPQLLLAEKI